MTHKYSPQEASATRILDSARGGFNRPFTLIHRSAGHTPRGYINEHYSVISGRTEYTFNTLQEAQDYFNTYTTAIIEERGQ